MEKFEITETDLRANEVELYVYPAELLLAEWCCRKGMNGPSGSQVEGYRPGNLNALFSSPAAFSAGYKRLLQSIIEGPPNFNFSNPAGYSDRLAYRTGSRCPSGTLLPDAPWGDDP